MRKKYGRILSLIRPYLSKLLLEIVQNELIWSKTKTFRSMSRVKWSQAISKDWNLVCGNSGKTLMLQCMWESWLTFWLCPRGQLRLILGSKKEGFCLIFRDIKFMLLVSPKPIVSPQLLLSCNIFSFSGNGVNVSSKM